MTAPKAFCEHRTRLVPTNAEYKASCLSNDMRGKLVAHAPGPQYLIVGCPTTYALMRRGLIRYPSRNKITPSHTMLSDEGRAVVCVILGQYADALTAAADFLDRISSSPPVVERNRELALAKFGIR